MVLVPLFLDHPRLSVEHALEDHDLKTLDLWVELTDRAGESAWSELTPHFLNETREYSRWKQDGTPRPNEQDIETEEELKAQKRYEVLSPAQCLERAKTRDDYTFVLHPLAGGIPVDRAWRGLRRYVEEVVDAAPGA